MAIQIRALKPALLNDYLAFFDRDAFADNPEWANCYCRFYQFPGNAAAWDRASAAVNREGISDRISEGKAKGYLAYVDGRVAGWCQAGRATAVPALRQFVAGLTIADPETTGVVTCFCIATPFRRQGLARQLLDAALAGFVAEGLKLAEAYPSKAANRECEEFPGPLGLYLDAGFVPVGETERRVIVRKALGE